MLHLKCKTLVIECSEPFITGGKQYKPFGDFLMPFLNIFLVLLTGPMYCEHAFYLLVAKQKSPINNLFRVFYSKEVLND